MANEPDEIGVKQLIVRITQNGDVAAFRELVDRFKSIAFMHAIRILRNREDAEEVVQDAFIKVFRSIGQFKEEAKFSTWFYRIVYNTSLTKLGKRKMNMISLDEEQENELFLYSETGKEWNQLQKQDREKYINIAISYLSTEDTIILSLYYVSENTLEEISVIVGCSKSAAKVRLHRARGRLHLLLIKLLKDEVNDLLR